MILGLRSAIYPAPDLLAAKRWYMEALGQPPYFDEPFAVNAFVWQAKLKRGTSRRPFSDPTHHKTITRFSALPAGRFPTPRQSRWYRSSPRPGHPCSYGPTGPCAATA